MKRALIAAALAMGVAGSVKAEVLPVGGAADQRVKTVNYDGNNVVRIVGHYGFVTHIQL
ncbi:conjugal transfer protein TrbG, partial [Mesorhizobium sp. M7A.T.Ca.US.000.02.1.1]